MKPLWIVFALVPALSQFAMAADSGKFLYRGKYIEPLTLSSVSADGKEVSFGTFEGHEKVPWSVVPWEIREKFLKKYSELLADHRHEATLAKARANARVEREKQLAQAAALTKGPDAQTKIAEATVSLERIETDLPSHVGRTLWIEGTIKPSSYYNYGYREAKDTHFAFRLEKGRGSANLYMERKYGEALRERLLNSGTEEAFCLVTFPAETYEESASSIFAELLYVLPKRTAQIADK